MLRVVAECSRQCVQGDVDERLSYSSDFAAASTLPMTDIFISYARRPRTSARGCECVAGAWVVGLVGSRRWGRPRPSIRSSSTNSRRRRASSCCGRSIPSRPTGSRVRLRRPCNGCLGACAHRPVKLPLEFRRRQLSLIGWQRHVACRISGAVRRHRGDRRCGTRSQHQMLRRIGKQRADSESKVGIEGPVATLLAC